MTKSVYGNVRLDAETAQLLANLAQPFEGNRSMALRAAIKSEAARHGITPVPVNSQARPERETMGTTALRVLRQAGEQRALVSGQASIREEP